MPFVTSSDALATSFRSAECNLGIRFSVAWLDDSDSAKSLFILGFVWTCQSFSIQVSLSELWVFNNNPQKRANQELPLAEPHFKLTTNSEQRE